MSSMTPQITNYKPRIKHTIKKHTYQCKDQCQFRLQNKKSLILQAIGRTQLPKTPQNNKISIFFKRQLNRAYQVPTQAHRLNQTVIASSHPQIQANPTPTAPEANTHTIAADDSKTLGARGRRPPAGANSEQAPLTP